MGLGWDFPVQTLALPLPGSAQLSSPLSTKARKGQFPNCIFPVLGKRKKYLGISQVLRCWDNTFLGYLLLSRSNGADPELNWLPG